MSAESPPPPPKSHALLIAACVVVMLAAVGVILEYRGPFRGWCGQLRAKLALAGFGNSPVVVPGDEATPVDGTSPVPMGPVAPTATVLVPSLPEPSVPTSPPPADLHSRYAELYAEHLARLPQPTPGSKCRLTLLSGEKVHGRLERVEPGRVTLRMEHGTQSFPVHVIRRKDVLRLFPATAARNEAMAALRREMAGGGAPPLEPAPQEPAARVPEASTQPLTVATTPLPDADVPRDSSRGYDPTPGPTPERLKPTLAAFGEWLKTQHRRVGGRIADKIYARRQGGRTVLYLRMDPMFMAQDYGTRYQIAEGMQIFWALRCQGTGVAGMGSAHVVLLDQANRIVGGSRPDDPTDIWLKGK